MASDKDPNSDVVVTYLVPKRNLARLNNKTGKQMGTVGESSLFGVAQFLGAKGQRYRASSFRRMDIETGKPDRDLELPGQTGVPTWIFP